MTTIFTSSCEADDAIHAISWTRLDAVIAVSFAHAADRSGLWKPMPVLFKIHSGIVSDRTPATPNERWLTVNIEGRAAKDIFDAIGPDAISSCSGDKGDRERREKGLWCVYTALDAQTKIGPYQC